MYSGLAEYVCVIRVYRDSLNLLMGLLDHSGENASLEYLRFRFNVQSDDHDGGGGIGKAHSYQ